MGQCRYELDGNQCPWDADEKVGEGLCILHSRGEKSPAAFGKRLEEHRHQYGNVFTGFVFPTVARFAREKFGGRTDFRHAVFSKDADFGHAKFEGKARFGDGRFQGDASFYGAKFKCVAVFLRTQFKTANFQDAEFGKFHQKNSGGKAGKLGDQCGEAAFFDNAKFHNTVVFLSTKFKKAKFPSTHFFKDADFSETTFCGEAYFKNAHFEAEAEFYGAAFRQCASFQYVTFGGRARFVAVTEKGRSRAVFPDKDSKAVIDFTNLIIVGPDLLILHDCDLSRCRFLRTDVRKIEFVGATWPKDGSRVVVYDELEAKEHQENYKYPHIEHVYRQLKQNYEERRDFERAGDFHHSEKEMRRLSSETSCGLRFLLTLYLITSGYGERYLRPLVCTGVLVLLGMVVYLSCGLQPAGEGGELSWKSVRDGLEALLYSLQVTFLLRPDDYFLSNLIAQYFRTLQTVTSPILIGLFALALRQRLRR